MAGKMCVRSMLSYIEPVMFLKKITVQLNPCLTEMSTINIPMGKGLPERKADNLTAICVLVL
jgi:hypothetical protein